MQRRERSCLESRSRPRALLSVPGPPVLFLKEGYSLLPMKVVQEPGSAQMLLLITDTSQSNSLLGWGGGSGLW